MYKQSLFRKISTFCAILSVILGVWSVLFTIYVVTETPLANNIFTLIFVIAPAFSIPTVFAVLAFVIRSLSSELAEETSSILAEIKELKKQIKELQK